MAMHGMRMNLKRNNRPTIQAMRDLVDHLNDTVPLHGGKFDLVMSRAYGRRCYHVTYDSPTRSASFVTLDVTNNEFHVTPWAQREARTSNDWLNAAILECAATCNHWAEVVYSLETQWRYPRMFSDTTLGFENWRTART